jgi:predicted O-methyltransferase YrrM
METFCLTALEAALTKTLVFTNDLAALQNTVGDRGIVVQGNPMTKEWQEKALEKIQGYFTSKMNNDGRQVIYKNYIQRNYNWATSLSWENQANKLLEQYILPNKLEYKGMYGWYNDLPQGTNAKDMFEMMLRYFNNYAQTKEKVKVLEIGSYTGISLINILQKIPNAVGYGVDMWSNYEEKTQYGDTDMLKNIGNLDVEKSFYKNMLVSGLESRMFGIKGDSHKVLMDMLCRDIEHKDNKFDLIYVDGSHSSIDTYTDCYMAWKLLNSGGMMIIDDYLYNIEDEDIPLLKIKNKDILEHSPYKGINKFLEKYKDEYKVLNISYRVFLEKI